MFLHFQAVLKMLAMRRSSAGLLCSFLAMRSQPPCCGHEQHGLRGGDDAASAME